MSIWISRRESPVNRYRALVEFPLGTAVLATYEQPLQPITTTLTEVWVARRRDEHPLVTTSSTTLTTLDISLNSAYYSTSYHRYNTPFKSCPRKRMTLPMRKRTARTRRGEALLVTSVDLRKVCLLIVKPLSSIELIVTCL